jgi:hypothetical protein
VPFIDPAQQAYIGYQLCVWHYLRHQGLKWNGTEELLRGDRLGATVQDKCWKEKKWGAGESNLCSLRDGGTSAEHERGRASFPCKGPGARTWLVGRGARKPMWLEAHVGGGETEEVGPAGPCWLQGGLGGL